MPPKENSESTHRVVLSHLIKYGLKKSLSSKKEKIKTDSSSIIKTVGDIMDSTQKSILTSCSKNIQQFSAHKINQNNKNISYLMTKSGKEQAHEDKNISTSPCRLNNLEHIVKPKSEHHIMLHNNDTTNNSLSHSKLHVSKNTSCLKQILHHNNQLVQLDNSLKQTTKQKKMNDCISSAPRATALSGQQQQQNRLVLQISNVINRKQSAAQISREISKQMKGNIHTPTEGSSRKNFMDLAQSFKKQSQTHLQTIGSNLNLTNKSKINLNGTINSNEINTIRINLNAIHTTNKINVNHIYLNEKNCTNGLNSNEICPQNGMMDIVNDLQTKGININAKKENQINFTHLNMNALDQQNTQESQLSTFAHENSIQLLSFTKDTPYLNSMAPLYLNSPRQLSSNSNCVNSEIQLSPTNECIDRTNVPCNIGGYQSKSGIKQMNEEESMKRKNVCAFQERLAKVKGEFEVLFDMYNDKKESSMEEYHQNVKFIECVEKSLIEVIEKVAKRTKEEFLSSFNECLGKCKGTRFEIQKILNYLQCTENDLVTNLDSIISDMDVSSLNEIIAQYSSIINNYQEIRDNHFFQQTFQVHHLKYKHNSDLLTQTCIELNKSISNILSSHNYSHNIQRTNIYPLNPSIPSNNTPSIPPDHISLPVYPLRSLYMSFDKDIFQSSALTHSNSDQIYPSSPSFNTTTANVPNMIPHHFTFKDVVASTDDKLSPSTPFSPHPSRTSNFTGSPYTDTEQTHVKHQVTPDALNYYNFDNINERLRANGWSQANENDIKRNELVKSNANEINPTFLNVIERMNQQNEAQKNIQSDILKLNKQQISQFPGKPLSGIGSDIYQSPRNMINDSKEEKIPINSFGNNLVQRITTPLEQGLERMEEEMKYNESKVKKSQSNKENEIEAYENHYNIKTLPKREDTAFGQEIKQQLDYKNALNMTSRYSENSSEDIMSNYTSSLFKSSFKNKSKYNELIHKIQLRQSQTEKLCTDILPNFRFSTSDENFSSFNPNRNSTQLSKV